MPIEKTLVMTCESYVRHVRTLAPGVAVSALGVLLALGVHHFWPAAPTLLVAIVLGIAFRNLVPIPQAMEPGLAYSAKRLLRIGVVLLGLQLVLADILALGWGMIAVVIAVVAIGFFSAMLMGRAMGVSPTQTVLIAGGFSICGAAAVAAVDGVVGASARPASSSSDEAKDGNGGKAQLSGAEEVVTAVALVVLFGTISIFLLPFLAHLMGLSEVATGMWAGASVHEVAQVVAIGGAISAPALSAAVIIKLARVLMLAPMMAGLGIWKRRRSQTDETQGKQPPLVPLFVAGFIAMVAVRSLGLVPAGILEPVKMVQTALLGAAMFALGCGVKFSMFKSVGAKPLLLAVFATVVVYVVGLIGVMLAG